MNEESESLSLLHPANIKMLELDNDSDCAFACRKNLILRGWHQWEVAMRGKGVTRRLRKPDQFLQYNAKQYASAKGWYEERKEGTYHSRNGFRVYRIDQLYFAGKGWQKGCANGACKRGVEDLNPISKLDVIHSL